MPNMLATFQDAGNPDQTKIGHKRDPFKIGIKTDRHPGDQGLASWEICCSPKILSQLAILLPRTVSQ